MTTRYLDWPNNLTRSELVSLLRSFATEALDIEHILGQALGFPIDHDGDVGPAGMPMVGEHTALTLAMAAAKRLGELDPGPTAVPDEATCTAATIDETSTRLYRCRCISGHDGPHRGFTPFDEPVVWRRES